MQKQSTFNTCEYAHHFYDISEVAMRLETKRKFCFCGGAILRFKDRQAQITVYTETGPIRMEHLESRCRKCKKGYFYGYTSESAEDDQEKPEKMHVTKQHMKMYEEDCLEAEVFLFMNIK